MCLVRRHSLTIIRYASFQVSKSTVSPFEDVLYTCISVVNPLEKAHATQSTINDNLRAPSLAIDGDYSTMMTTSFPPDEANPWWNVELRCEQTIEAVRLWSRDDGFRKLKYPSRHRYADSI